jgi:hypothetical protein
LVLNASSWLADYYTLMMEAIFSSEGLVFRRAAPRNIQEDGISRSHRREDLNSYIALTDWAL